jgi:hypothetical protein
MPFSVRKDPRQPRGRQWLIVKEYRSGRTEVVGHSGTQAKAQTSARIRGAAEKK